MTTNHTAEIDRFRRAKHVYETSRLGAPAYYRADATMERIVCKAERDGWLDELLAALYPKATV